MLNKFGILLLFFAASSAKADLIDGEELVDPTRPLFIGRGDSDTDVLTMIRNVVPAS